MITDDEVMRLFERADPARFDDAAPLIDAAGYLDALRTRSSDMTIIEIPPTPTGPKNRHRWPIITAVAAAVVALLAAGALVIAAEDDDTDEIPATPTTTAVAPDTAAAEVIARGFLEAENAYDADRALTYLSDQYIATELGTPEEYRLGLALSKAQAGRKLNIDCEQQSESDSGIVIRCTHDHHTLRSDEIGLGPYRGDYTDFTIRDGKIVAVEAHLAFMTNGFSAQMWEPFADWVAAEHPDDVLKMYEDGSQTEWRITEEFIALWEQRTREYAAADTRVGFIGLAPEGATPSTPDSAELVEAFAWCDDVPVARRIGGIGICKSMIWVYDDGRLIWYLHENLPEGANPFSTGLLEQRLTPDGVELFRSDVDKTTDPDELVARLRDPDSWPAGTWEDPQIRAYVPPSYNVCFLQTERDGPIGAESLALLPAPAHDMAQAWDWEDNHYLEGPFDYCSRSRPTEEARGFAAALDDAQVEQGWRENPYALTYQFGPSTATVYLVIDPALPHGFESWESRG